ncbi:DUF5058 family protein [Microbacterium sp. 18062]|uniref:DUF5058 family protein n=1 Tax=Microbacterium sp. 18062 TaxID=2681410 RepID=UPI0013582DCF|nr:DUF5058 family protein [Microbacterium sp. 18062]
MRTVTLSVDPGSTNILPAANQPYLWIAAVGVFAVIAVQSIIYLRAVGRVAPAVDMPKKEVSAALRAGAVASIAPSLAVALIAITLISVLGTPGALVRIGLIGSAPYELAAADMVARTLGATLGGDGYTQAVFATAFLAMGIAGCGWMVVTLVLTPLMKRGTRALEGSQKAKTAGAMALIPAAALLGAFTTFGMQQIVRGLAAALVLASSALVMLLCLWIAKKAGQNWLREWGLGISLVVGLVVGGIVSGAGIA